MSARAGAERRTIDRAVIALALPALGALVAEPLFVATDTAMIGHLGAVPLAAVGIAGTLLQTVVGLMVFLAYATTPLVARRLGAGDPAGAVRAGIDGMWLALAIGALLVVALQLVADAAPTWLGADPAIVAPAALYLRIASLGVPGMLVLIAATGLFRGLQDTRTPLVIAVAGSAANAALNAVLIYGLGWGIAGSAAGTAVLQTAMGAAAVTIAVREARRQGAPLRPGRSGILRSAGTGGWVLLRTVTLRAVLLGTMVVATGHGTIVLAATTILFTVFSVVSLALDALAVAGQSLIGHALGAGDGGRARAIVRRLLVLGALAGAAAGALLAAASPVLGSVFTSDETVLAALHGGLLLLAAACPLGALVFVLDGVLLGAGDGRHLALLGVVNLAVALPALWLVGTLPLDAAGAVLAVQAVFQLVFMTTRFVFLGARVRGGRWIRLGVAPA